MGCKCGRDILFGENEIIKAEAIKAHYDKKKKKETITINNSISTFTINNSNNGNSKNNTINNYLSEVHECNYNYKKSDINFIPKKGEEALTFNYMDGTQRSFLDIPINKEISETNEYPKKTIALINEIRANPSLYSKIVEKSIKNIKITKNNQIIYCNIVKVALHRGEEAFREAINKLKNTGSMPPLRFNPQICIPLPKNEMELNEQNFLKTQVDKIRKNNHNYIEIYFKDLIKIPEVSVLLMIVDDNSKNTSKKRDTLLNENFKFIGVNSKFIGKNFVAHFSFSR